MKFLFNSPFRGLGGKAIFLIGFMGSGKTYWGKRWANNANINFIDLDEAIEQVCGKTVAQIFDKEGEDFFREKETEILQSLTFAQPTIVACGGGTPCFNNNLEWMNNKGITIYLKTTVPTLVERILQEQEKRPLLKNINSAEIQFYVQQKLAEREPYYSKANIILQDEELKEDTINQLIIKNE